MGKNQGRKLASAKALGIFKQADGEAPLRYHLNMVMEEARESAVSVVWRTAL